MTRIIFTFKLDFIARLVQIFSKTLHFDFEVPQSFLSTLRPFEENDRLT
jgi:hypothetical protein